MTLSRNFFEHIRTALLGGKMSQQFVDGCNAIDARFTGQSVQEKSYALATAYHESAHTMAAIMERGPRAYFNKYEGRADLGNIHKGDGYLFRGRGLAQITGRRNYTLFGIHNKPDDALKLDVAVEILYKGMTEGVFTGRKLSDYFGTKKNDPVGARHIINGNDKDLLIAGYYRTFLDAYNTKQEEAEVDTPTPPVVVTGTPAVKSTTNIAATVAASTTMIGAASDIASSVSDAVDKGKSLKETVLHIASTPLVIIAVVVLIAAIYIIEQRIKHARESGV